jgi:hypothetical protein
MNEFKPIAELIAKNHNDVQDGLSGAVALISRSLPDLSTIDLSKLVVSPEQIIRASLSALTTKPLSKPLTGPPARVIPFNKKEGV